MTITHSGGTPPDIDRIKYMNASDEYRRGYNDAYQRAIQEILVTRPPSRRHDFDAWKAGVRRGIRFVWISAILAFLAGYLLHRFGLQFPS